jgi:Sec-independent protein secretion pathway component TatC
VPIILLYELSIFGARLMVSPHKDDFGDD